MEKMQFFSFDFRLGREYLREVAALAVLDFQERGGVIKQLPPAFALGCETPASVRQMVRKER